jgi:hypothetical protein
MAEARRPDIDSPYTHNKTANELEARQDIRGAESEFKAAVNAADKLPYALYRKDFLSELGKYELSGTYEAYPGIGVSDLRQAYHKLLVLPFATRFQLAAFYARHSAFPEAGEVIEQAFKIGIDDLVIKDDNVIKLLKRAQDFHRIVTDIVGPSRLSKTFEENFERMDLDKNGFIHEDELKKAQLDIGIDSEGQKMIRHLLYHYLEAEASSHDEWVMDISGLSRKDVINFEQKRNKTWKRLPDQ